MKGNMVVFSLLCIIFCAISVSGVIHLPPKMIVSPEDIYFVKGTTSNNLVWQFEAEESEDHPTFYTVTVDDIILEDHNNKSWFDNVDIIVNVDFLEVGDHEVKITVYDDGYPDYTTAAEDIAIAHVVSSAEELPTTDLQETSSLHSSGYFILIFSLTVFTALKGKINR